MSKHVGHAKEKKKKRKEKNHLALGEAEAKRVIFGHFGEEKFRWVFERNTQRALVRCNHDIKKIWWVCSSEKDKEDILISLLKLHKQEDKLV